MTDAKERARAFAYDHGLLAREGLIEELASLLAAEREAGRNEALPPGFLLMSRETFDRNISEAHAAGRREALEEAAKICLSIQESVQVDNGKPLLALICSDQIRALIDAGGEDEYTYKTSRGD